MNWRVVLISVVSLAFLSGTGFALWSFLAAPSSVETISPSPEPSIAVGALPSASSDPLATPSISAAPIAFTGVCPDSWVSQQDTDGDTLPDSVEATYGTDADVKDTDADGYSDGEEVRAGYNPASAASTARLDSDNDALLDHEECTWVTDPFNPDSDADGFLDGVEVKNGFNPTKKGDGKGSDRLIIATPEATTTPLVDLSQPTPTARPSSSVVPITIQTAPQSTAKLSLVPVSSLKITPTTTSADVKAYLAQIDSLRPQEFSDGQMIADAIQRAGTGDVKPLSAVRIRIAEFAAELKNSSTPKPAQEYQQLYVSLIEFTVQKLQIIESNATGSSQQLAVQAVLDIQNVLPSHLLRLSELRQAVEGISNT